MPTLAIAGGASPSLGRAITTALLSSPHNQKWDIILLSRTTNRPIWLRAIDLSDSRVKILKVDYKSPSTLDSALQGVDTLISVIRALDGTQEDIQIALLHAAVKAGCRRFIPSLWGVGIEAYRAMSVASSEVARVLEECKKAADKIEWANFSIGTFMNYIGHGIYAVPGDSKSEEDEETKLKKLREGGGYMAGEDEACQGLSREGDLTDGSGGWCIGLKNGIAEIPVKSGDENAWPRVTFTQLTDVGRFVVAALELGKWEEEMSIGGDTLDMGQLLAHAEEVTGKKFKVEKKTREQLETKARGLTSPEQFEELMWTQFMIEATKDKRDSMWFEPIVNKLCPEVKPMGVREYMEKHWKAANV